MAGRRRRRPHIQRWAAAAALLCLLHRWRAAAAWAAAIYGVWLLLVGHLLARRAAAPFLLIMRRAHALRHRSGQRRRASVALFHLSPNLLQVNLGQRPRKRHQRLPAATETSAAVICTPLDIRSSGLI